MRQAEAIEHLPARQVPRPPVAEHGSGELLPGGARPCRGPTGPGPAPKRGQRTHLAARAVKNASAAGLGSSRSRGSYAFAFDRGTLTVVVVDVRLPAASRHATSMVYRRPRPVPLRSARSSASSGPVI